MGAIGPAWVALHKQRDERAWREHYLDIPRQHA